MNHKLFTIVLCFAAAVQFVGCTAGEKLTAEQYFERGEKSMLEKKDYDKALADFNKAIEANPNYFPAYYRRGHIYLEKKEFDKSIADFTKCIELQPNHEDSYLSRSYAYSDKGDRSRAESDYAEYGRVRMRNGGINPGY